MTTNDVKYLAAVISIKSTYNIIMIENNKSCQQSNFLREYNAAVSIVSRNQNLSLYTCTYIQISDIILIA